MAVDSRDASSASRALRLSRSSNNCCSNGLASSAASRARRKSSRVRVSSAICLRRASFCDSSCWSCVRRSAGSCCTDGLPSANCICNPTMTSVQPLIDSINCSWSCLFSAFAFRRTLSANSFATMFLLSSMTNLSIMMDMSRRLSTTVWPCICGWGGSTASTTSDMGTKRFAWKHRSVSAMASRAARDSAIIVYVFWPLNVSSKRTESSAWMMTLGYSAVYSAVASRWVRSAPSSSKGTTRT
mmetsp:Transcript_40334/g.116578  ORF Transcript_40334/g.116578 Transcript_40334/m.116578 type:complete len:242 (+) Transcript_40334:610-1335(+)